MIKVLIVTTLWDGDNPVAVTQTVTQFSSNEAYIQALEEIHSHNEAVESTTTINMVKLEVLSSKGENENRTCS